jgi:hypothetical protein
MTAVMAPPDRHAWGSMPGWDVVADMTPPELVQQRWIAVLRRRIASGCLLVLVICAATFGYAAVRHQAARDEAAAASDRTTQLTRRAERYSGITVIETTVAGLDRQVGTLLENDVDLPRTVTAINRALPGSMTIQAMSVTLIPGGSVEGEGSLDRSGHPSIGSVNISGAGRTLDDLPTFVDRLAAIRGVVDVLPSSNVVAGRTAQYSVSLTLTDALYTHRFDVSEDGKK